MPAPVFEQPNNKNIHVLHSNQRQSQLFEVALYEPEIPPNTGNIIRLCANTGCRLHLIEPLGFSLDDRSLKRAGLDYHEYANLCVHTDYEAFLAANINKPICAFSTHHKIRHSDAQIPIDAILLFGPETRGLPEDVRNRCAPEHRLTLAMKAKSRSLNLSNSVAIAVYETWRQHNYAGAL